MTNSLFLESITDFSETEFIIKIVQTPVTFQHLADSSVIAFYIK